MSRKDLFSETLIVIAVIAIFGIFILVYGVCDALFPEKQKPTLQQRIEKLEATCAVLNARLSILEEDTVANRFGKKK